MLVTTYLANLMEASAERFTTVGARPPRGPGEPRRCGDDHTLKQRYDQILSEVHDPEEARRTLERIINGNDLTDVAFLERGAICARSVGRVVVRSDDDRILMYGTGFLVAPGVLMTNHHVIGDPALTRRSTVNFDFERDARGADKVPVDFAMIDETETIAVPDLDFALVRIAPTDVTGATAISAYRWMKLSAIIGKTLENEYLTIIQHPAAQPKQVCVRENRLLEYRGDTLWYQTDTLGGSSGAPVFNQSWQVVALHHSGVPELDRRGRYKLLDGTWWDPNADPPVDETQIKWKANEGIRISSILARLQGEFAARPLAQAVLSASVPAGAVPPEQAFSGGGFVDGRPTAITTADGRRVRIVVPVEITMGIAGDPGALAPVVRVPPASPVVSPADYGVYPKGDESLTIKTSDYPKRNGFQPGFLDASDPDLKVPLPKPANGVAASFTIGGAKTSELKYWNFSVMLHAKRKLALFSAAHVDFGQKKSQSGDATWIKDSRAKDAQIGQEFYKKQKELEATSRVSNPFDQGHLHMQAHATWGSTSTKANVSGADTFHYPNCAPQFFQYNQGHPDKQEPGDKGTKLWRGLEDFITSRLAAADNKRCIIITGPLFDAPKSPLVGGQPKVDLKGKRAPDPTFGGVKIPKMFYKIVCVVRSGKLAASAFVISQEDYLAKIAKLKPGVESFTETLTLAQATVYRVSIPDLEKVTGLDFGLAGRSIPWFESAMSRSARITSWADLAI